MNGSGYPFGLTEDQIPLLVQIATVADIFDALTSDRSYRAKMSDEKAFKIMDGDVAKGELNGMFVEILKQIRREENGL